MDRDDRAPSSCHHEKLSEALSARQPGPGGQRLGRKEGMGGNMKRQLLMAAALALLPATAMAQDKPDSLHIGIATFLTGPASVFGVPARDAAEIIAERINDEGGIEGVPISLTYIDEGAGGESMMAEYRRLVEDQGVEIFFAAVSSGSCGAIAPVAEDLEVLNILWDCGTQRIFEENDYKYVYRTQANATPEMLGALLYLLKTNPDFSTIRSEERRVARQR